MQRMGWAARIVWRATVVIGLVTTAATLTAPSNAFAVSEPTVAPKASPSPAAVGTVVQLGEKVKGSTGAFAYRWSLLAQPVGSSAVLSATSGATPTLIPDVPGTYQLSLTVTDSHGLRSAPASIDVQVS
jgi:hypothetical protein